MHVNSTVRGQQVTGAVLMVDISPNGVGGDNLYLLQWFLHKGVCVSVRAPFL